MAFSSHGKKSGKTWAVSMIIQNGCFHKCRDNTGCFASWFTQEFILHLWGHGEVRVTHNTCLPPWVWFSVRAHFMEFGTLWSSQTAVSMTPLAWVCWVERHRYEQVTIKIMTQCISSQDNMLLTLGAENKWTKSATWLLNSLLSFGPSVQYGFCF